MSEPLDLVEYNRRWVDTHRDNRYQAEAARRITVLLAEVERLRADRDEQGRFLSVVAEFARTTGMSHREAMESVGVKADRDDLEHRLASLLCDLTGGKMSKTGYDVQTMAREIEAEFEQAAQEDRAELQADRDRLAATVERVRELAESLTEQGDEHVRGCMGQADCAACVQHDLRDALEGPGS